MHSSMSFRQSESRISRKILIVRNTQEFCGLIALSNRRVCTQHQNIEQIRFFKDNDFCLSICGIFPFLNGNSHRRINFHFKES